MKIGLYGTRHTTMLLAIITLLAGCTGSRTFHDYAQAGDTVAVAAGWAHHLQRDNIEVTITDADNNSTTYTPGTPAHDVAVRGSVNFYPDPVSSLVVSDRLNKDLTPSSKLYAGLINQYSTGDDRDWWETVIFIDLPDSMALGDATIDIVDLNSSANETASSIVTIVVGDGTRNSFHAKLGATPFTVEDSHFQSMERTDHFIINFSGATLPYAIQVDLTHAPDEGNGGSGTPYAINPIGHIKNLSWAQTGTGGTDLRVIITPARDGEITTMEDFKFYVAGGISGLGIVDQDTLDGQGDFDVLAFDINGNPLADITATVVAGN